MDGSLAMGFHSPRLERPQEKLVPSLLLIPRVPCTASTADAVFSNMGLSGAPWDSRNWQDLRRL